MVVHVGGLDLLIVSPEPGNPEPLYQMLRPEQVSSDAAKVYLKFTKETKNADGTGWAWSFRLRRIAKKVSVSPNTYMCIA